MSKQKKDASRRVTIVISEQLNKEVRLRQARKIEISGKNVSFSAVIQQLVRKGLAA